MKKRAPDFSKDLLYGDQAMLMAIQKLESLPETISVIDVSKVPLYQNMDIDMLWVRAYENKEIVSRVEVKGDSYPERNFYLEAWSNIERGTPGCIVKTQADFIMYLFVQTQNYYLLDASDLRTFMFAHPDYHCVAKHKRVVNKLNNGASYTSVGIATEINQTLKAVRHYRSA